MATRSLQSTSVAEANLAARIAVLEKQAGEQNERARVRALDLDKQCFLLQQRVDVLETTVKRTHNHISVGVLATFVVFAWLMK